MEPGHPRQPRAGPCAKDPGGNDPSHRFDRWLSCSLRPAVPRVGEGSANRYLPDHHWAASGRATRSRTGAVRGWAGLNAPSAEAVSVQSGSPSRPRSPPLAWGRGEGAPGGSPPPPLSLHCCCGRGAVGSGRAAEALADSSRRPPPWGWDFPELSSGRPGASGLAGGLAGEGPPRAERSEGPLGSPGSVTSEPRPRPPGPNSAGEPPQRNPPPSPPLPAGIGAKKSWGSRQPPPSPCRPPSPQLLEPSLHPF
ncbi:collagen alpha-1(I) chain-like [Gracilinanus agilis]|uniref:collagen alpha-1(I) chain-like n=1 Tax=Gracilinanus agilis TaxID=191870 RepID=UPI001CFC4FB8|nr:collagen alpha-1(I) chain-like [Gracilinanus agilis]